MSRIPEEAEFERRQRAEARRARVTLRRTHLQKTETDLDPVYGVAALSLVDRLTRESWSLAGHEVPDYSRHDVRCSFVPRARA